MDRRQIREQVEARERAAAEDMAKREKEKAEEPKKTPQTFIRDCLHANESGDGVLYAYLHADLFRWDPRGEIWFFWNGTCWQEDRLRCRAVAASEQVTNFYADYLASLERRRKNLTGKEA